MSGGRETLRKVGSGGVLLNAADLAGRWQVTERYVRALANAGRLPVVRLGPRLTRFRLSDVEAFERAGESNAAPADSRPARRAPPRR